MALSACAMVGRMRIQVVTSAIQSGRSGRRTDCLVHSAGWPDASFPPPLQGMRLPATGVLSNQTAWRGREKHRKTRFPHGPDGAATGLSAGLLRLCFFRRSEWGVWEPAQNPPHPLIQVRKGRLVWRMEED